MAKPRRIEGLTGGEAYATAAAKIIEVRLAELIEHSQGLLDTGDIERVHDMRVATRRLRAVLEIFRPCFPRGELKAALRQVKALADALGERRDRDVAIAALGDIAGSMTAQDRAGIGSLIAKLEVERVEANRELARIASADRLASIADQLSELVAGLEPVEAAAGTPVLRPVGG
jgi:CHAD domain-containing protein